MKTDYKNTSTVSAIVGVLVKNETSALDAIQILEQAKETYLERSYHISTRKKGGTN